MGLIKAITGAAGGVLADQWKEFFYCDAIKEDVLVVKGQKRTSSRSSNTKGEENIISNGSGIAVADGQCMIIVEQGRVVDICAIPGEYTYDKSTEPSIFAGNLGESIKRTFQAIGKRFTYGGDTGKDQRVYYFNTKELIDNKFGSSSPIPFRVVDSKINLDIDVSVRCSGVYSYKIEDPILFYTNVCANVVDEYKRETIEPQLKTEFVNALAGAIGELSELEIRPNQIGRYNDKIANDLNIILSDKWSKLRGLKVVSVAFNPIVVPEEDMELIKQEQRTARYRDPGLGAATIVGAQADAMRSAGSNSAGAMTGFMGMGMAMNQANAMNVQGLYNMAQQQAPQQATQQAPQQAPQQTAPAQNGWTCSCGAVTTGKFCTECGKPKPQQDGWTCACGAVNKGKFCAECGAKKPEDAPLYKCDKCGWEPEDPKNPPRFCPECGDPFNDSDII